MNKNDTGTSDTVSWGIYFPCDMLEFFDFVEDAVNRKEIQERLRRVIEHGVKTNGMHSISAENVLEFVSNMPSLNQVFMP